MQSESDLKLAAVAKHLEQSRELLRALPLPRYPGGGEVGAAALSAILRGLREANEELSGLREQLEQNAQAARRVGGPGKPETLCVFAPWPQSY